MTRYKLDEGQPRLEEFCQQVDVGQLADEICLARWLIERATNAKSYGLANAILATTARLSSAHEAAQVRSSQQLSRLAVIDFAKRLTTAVMDLIDDLPIDKETRIQFADRLIASVTQCVSETRNPDSKILRPLQLEGPSPSG